MDELILVQSYQMRRPLRSSVTSSAGAGFEPSNISLWSWKRKLPFCLTDLLTTNTANVTDTPAVHANSHLMAWEHSTNTRLSVRRIRAASREALWARATTNRRRSFSMKNLLRLKTKTKSPSRVPHRISKLGMRKLKLKSNQANQVKEPLANCPKRNLRSTFLWQSLAMKKVKNKIGFLWLTTKTLSTNLSSEPSKNKRRQTIAHGNCRLKNNVKVISKTPPMFTA